MPSRKGKAHHHADLLLAAGRPDQTWTARLRSDFRLAIISLFGVCAIVLVMPFAVYRFAVGDFLIGVGDSALVAVIGLLVVYAWRSGKTVLVGRLLSVAMTVGYLLMVSLFPVSVMWTFPLLMCNFLVADRYVALTNSVLVLVIMGVQTELFPATLETWSFVATGVLVSLFGMIFATRTEIQRQQLAELAQRDALTGACNRRALRDDLDRTHKALHENNQPAALALADLDHFKSVNDRFGHEEGDRILVDLVDIMQSTLRQQDRVYRIGGEEFVVLFHLSDQAGLEAALNKLHAAIREDLACPDGPVTISIGAAMLERNEGVRDWLGRADVALYRAKRKGRDSVEIASADSGTSGAEARRRASG